MACWAPLNHLSSPHLLEHVDLVPPILAARVGQVSVAVEDVGTVWHGGDPHAVSSEILESRENVPVGAL